MMFMKKVVGIFIFIILFIFIGMFIMVCIDGRYLNGVEMDIVKNTNIKDIEYIIRYGNGYIVMDLDYLYLFNDKYEELDKLELEKIYNNKNSYDIVYRDKTFMYMDNYKNKDGVMFKYYDIETYEEIDEVMVGGN